MCGTAERLVVTQYVFGADSLLLTQYVPYIEQFNAETMYVVQRTI